MNTAANPELTYDKQGVVARLRSSQERFLKATADVPERLSTVRPAEGAWSVLQVAEHIALAEQVMLNRFQNGAVNSAPPDLERDGMILDIGLDRTQKLQAPDTVVPAGRYKSLAQAVADFRRAREQTIAYVEATNEDLRRKAVMHPLGQFDGYQYLLIMALHPERHALQIDEIKNSPAYRAGH